MKNRVSGVVLSGGNSKRMGEDKGLLSFDGKPLVMRNLGFLEDLCEEVMISANDDAYEGFNYPVIHDSHKGIGPMAGVCEALKHASYDSVLLLSCDLFFPEGTMLQTLIHKMDEGYELVAYRKDDRAEPLFACYSKKLLPVIETMIEAGNYKLQNLIREAKACLLDVQEKEIINVNTKEDYYLAKKIFASKEK